MKNIVIIVQARMGSTRLPGKIIKTVSGIPLLLFQYQRLAHSTLANKIVIATTTNKNDILIENLCKENSILSFRGSENDVLKRYYDAAIYFKADGQQRGKIGVSPQRATNVMGSYEDVSGTLTIIKFNKPANETNYVNSKFEIQDNPFKGDVINSYNDGPPEPSFYELESSSPAAALGIGDKITHEQYTFHFEGNETELNTISMKILGVSLEEISMIFK